MAEKFSFKDCRFIFDMTKFCHKTAAYSLEDFVNQFVENAELDQIPEVYLIRAFKARVDLETSQHFPTALKNESFKDYAERCIEVFPTSASHDLITTQYLSASIDYSKFAESIRDLHKLSIKAYKGLPDFQAQFAFKLRLKELLVKDNDLWSFVRDYSKQNHLLVEDLILRHSENVARNKLLHRYNGKNSDTTPSSYHSSNVIKIKCNHCQFNGHLEEDCRRKQEGKPKGDYTKKIFNQL
uniref:CCHC-type domain-containing protein n=1 Tax=Strongyloides papillosus TaxID=174720 RepID=A0A0N5C9N8_STREA